MSFEEKDLQRLEDLRSELHYYLGRLNDESDRLLNLEYEINRLDQKQIEACFAEFIKAGFIPGTVFTKDDDNENEYQIVGISRESFLAIKTTEPDKIYMMRLWDTIRERSIMHRYSYRYTATIPAESLEAQIPKQEDNNAK